MPWPLGEHGTRRAADLVGQPLDPVDTNGPGDYSAARPGSLIWSLSPLPDAVRAPIEATGATILAPVVDSVAQLAAVAGPR